MRNRMYGGVRGRKTKVGEKLLRFPPTRCCMERQSAVLFYYLKKNKIQKYSSLFTFSS